MNNFRLYTFNYADENILANYLFSSEQTAFPVTNAFNFQRRSKVWRSNGYWVITTSNNILIFRETTGVDLTASIAPGTYTSTDSFLQAIEDAMNLSGASTYTVTMDNLKIKIASDLSGGGNIFGLRLSGSTIASTIGLTTVRADSATSYYVMDEIIITQEEWITFDMGVGTNPDALIMIDQRNKSIQIPPTGTVKLEGNDTSNFSSPQFSYTIPYDSEVFSYLTDNGIATTQYRYWRVHFNAACCIPNGYVQLGALFLGNYWSISRGRSQFPLSNEYIDRSELFFSESGQSFNDIKETTAKFSVTFSALQKADIEYFDDFFDLVGVSKPFFVSMDTAAAFSSDYRRRIILCKFDSPPTWTLDSPDNFTMELILREEL